MAAALVDGGVASASQTVRVALTGSSSPLGVRVARMLGRSSDVELTEIDLAGSTLASSGSSEESPHEVGLESDTRFDVVVDLGSSDYDARAARRESSTWFTASSLATADACDASHVVFVSSAMVYGAFANNALPLVEEAVLRPDVEFVFARQLASAEELVEQWRLARADRSTSVLRPVIVVAADGSSRLATAYVSGLGRRLAEDDPPSQFLHLDDLASAIAVAVHRRLDGVFNIAPDGWVPGERVRALSGERPRLPLPDRVSEVIGRLRWRFQRGPIPPGLRSYTREPWVVANGRMRDQDWHPTVTNEQAYVESTEARWWTMISPKRRQELALGSGVAALAVAVCAAAVAGRRVRCRRHTRQ